MQPELVEILGSWRSGGVAEGSCLVGRAVLWAPGLVSSSHGWAYGDSQRNLPEVIQQAASDRSEPEARILASGLPSSPRCPGSRAHQVSGAEETLSPEDFYYRFFLSPWERVTVRVYWAPTVYLVYVHMSHLVFVTMLQGRNQWPILQRGKWRLREISNQATCHLAEC